MIEEIRRRAQMCWMGHQNPHGKIWSPSLTAGDSYLGKERTESWDLFLHSFHKLSSSSMPGTMSLSENILERASLVVQWLRIRLPRQGTRVRALVREDPTCRGATKPVSHNYWACALEPASHNCWAHVPGARAPQQEEPQQWEACAPQQSSPRSQQPRESPHAAMKTQWSQK